MQFVLKIGLAALMTMPVASLASEEKTGYCELAGLAFGADKDLVGSIAARLVTRSGLMGDATCQSIWSEGFRQGERIASGAQDTSDDIYAWERLQSFENRVLDSIIDDLPES